MSNLRLTEVAVTKEFSAGVPVWTHAVIYTVPYGASAFSFAAFGNTQYAARQRTQDVFDQFSAWSDYTTHTSTAGADSLSSSALDHEITETEIADDSISTPKLQANSVTAKNMLVGDVGNLLTNPSFETGDLTGWITAPTGTGSVAATDGRAHGGVYSCVLSPGSSGTTQLVSEHYVPHDQEAGPVTLSFWGFGSSSPVVSFTVAYYNASKTYLGSATAGSTGAMGAAWQQYTARLAPPSTAYFIRVNIVCSTANAAAYIDDIVLMRGGVNINSGGITIYDGQLEVTDAAGATTISGGVVKAAGVEAGAISTGHLKVGDFKRADFSNLLVNGSFEEVYPAYSTGVYYTANIFPGWDRTSSAIDVAASTSANTKDGELLLAFKDTGSGGSGHGLRQNVPVKAGRTYRLSGWAYKLAASGQPVQLVAHTRDKTGAFVSFNVMIAVNHSSTTITYGEAYYTVPATGVAYLAIYCRTGGVPSASEVFAFEDVKVEEVPAGLENTAAEVVIDNTGLTVTNGKVTVSNAGSTVIIDGSSNMFKIQTTGTLGGLASVAASGGNVGNASTSVTLSSLGTQSAVPGNLCYVSLGSGTTTAKFLSHYFVNYTSMTWDATSSGGADTTSSITYPARFGLYIALNGSNQAVVTLFSTTLTTGYTSYGRYYVLKEAAF